MNTISEPHTIYFDPDDAEMDGLGWNVVGDWDSAVAARFATRDEAGRYCETMGIAAQLPPGITTACAPGRSALRARS